MNQQSWQPIDERIAASIETHGQFLMAVMRDPQDGAPAFVYTIGNASRGLPELLLVGNFRPDDVGMILNCLGDIMRERREPLEGEVSVGGTFPVRCRWAGADARRDYTCHAGRWLGHDEYAVTQVLFCDREGRFPGDAGFDPAFTVPLV
jgi:hypothetical protein